jgi:hypothetical protein
MTGVEKRVKKRMLAVNERGQLIGESHPGAVLSDHEVDVLLELRDEGKSMGWLAEKFEVSKSCVAKIIWGQRRGQTVARYKAPGRARGE